MPPLAALPPAALHAQGGVGTVCGVVYDSLARRPLAGARVWTGDGSRATTTDDEGRFTLDSVATDGRPLALLAEHPAADSAGLPTLAAAVAVPPGGTARATVAIPSYATLRAAACAGLPDAGSEEGGVLFGTVRNAVSGNPVRDAVVRVSWLRFRGRGPDGRARRADVVEESLDAVTDGSGVYYACGLPTSSDVTVRALAVLDGAPDTLASGELAGEIGRRRIRRRDLLVGGRRTGIVVAQVSGPDGAPLAGARVHAGDGEPVTADVGGRALLHAVPTGTRAVAARRIGFAPGDVTVEVTEADTAHVRIRLATVPQQLAAVRVRGVRRLVEVEQRARSGFGRLVTGEQLARSPTLHAVFRQVPGVRTTGSSIRFGVIGRQISAMGAGECMMSVYVDGRRGTMDELQLFAPADLLAVEVYPRGIHAPQMYVRPEDMAACGVVLVWTK